MNFRPLLLFSVALALVFAILGVGGTASAEEEKLVGVITKIDIGSGGKVAEVTLNDPRSDKKTVLIFTSEISIDKFKFGKLVEGDEVRVKYEIKDGKNHATFIRKAAGE